MLVVVALSVMGWRGKIRFFCGDETRIGLKTIGGRKITATGVKPIGQVLLSICGNLHLWYCRTENRRAFFL